MIARRHILLFFDNQIKHSLTKQFLIICLVNECFIIVIEKSLANYYKLKCF